MSSGDHSWTGYNYSYVPNYTGLDDGASFFTDPQFTTRTSVDQDMPDFMLPEQQQESPFGEIASDVTGVNSREQDISEAKTGGPLDLGPALETRVHQNTSSLVPPSNWGIPQSGTFAGASGVSPQQAHEICGQSLGRLSTFFEKNSWNLEEINYARESLASAIKFHNWKVPDSTTGASEYFGLGARDKKLFYCQVPVGLNGEICKAECDSSGAFKRHYTIMHFPCPRWTCPAPKCPESEKEFTRKDRFREHLKNVHHYEEKIYTMQQVERFVSNRTQLKLKQPNLPSKCLVCGNRKDGWDEQKLFDCVQGHCQSTPVSPSVSINNSAINATGTETHLQNSSAWSASEVSKDFTGYTHQFPKNTSSEYGNQANQLFPTQNDGTGTYSTSNFRPQSTSNQRHPATSISHAVNRQGRSQSSAFASNRIQKPIKAVKCSGCEHNFNGCENPRCQGRTRSSKKCHNCPPETSALHVRFEEASVSDSAVFSGDTGNTSTLNSQVYDIDSSHNPSSLQDHSSWPSYSGQGFSFMGHDFRGLSNSVSAEDGTQRVQLMLAMTAGDVVEMDSSFKLISMNLHGSCIKNLPMMSSAKRLSKQLQYGLKTLICGDTSELESTIPAVTDVVTEKDDLTITTIESPQAVFECQCPCRLKAQSMLLLDQPEVEIPGEQPQLDLEVLPEGGGKNTFRNRVRKVINLLRLRFVIQKEQKKQRQAMMKDIEHRLELAIEPAPHHQKPDKCKDAGECENLKLMPNDESEHDPGDEFQNTEFGGT
ncbi:hypothetical protein N7495_009645 [Penicillium taxi]|uniref:uncharacterized protein n=1 Tax=Penicillium taxi TaxID=168475 RepID=UPI0025455C4C|nr:uncharacterized protein N7495_009645 [Penicillium taxi]KAJ5885135.1 hypothetical protein N7495_009645 [Penicillium taxi]